MRERAEVHHNRVTVIADRPYTRRKPSKVEIPRDLLEVLQQYDARDITDALGALRRVGPHPHYWTTAGEVAKRSLTEPITAIWYVVDYDYSHWETMEVYSVRRENENTIWFYDSVDDLKSKYLDESYEYHEDHLSNTEEDWMEMARSDEPLYDTQAVLVLEPHPTLF